MKTGLGYLIFVLIQFQTIHLSYSQNEAIQNGRAYFAKNQFNQAAKCFEECAAQSELCRYFAGLAHHNAGNEKNALKYFFSVKSIDSVRSFHSGLIYWDIARCYANLGQNDSAIFFGKKELENVHFQIQTDQVKARLYHQIGLCFYKLEMYDSSITYLDQSHELDSQNASYLYTLVKANWFAKNPEVAFELIDYFLIANPDNLTIILLRGDLMFDASMDGALEYYNRAINLGYKPEGMRKKIIRMLRKLEKNSV